MSDAFFKQPILNSPYDYPVQHWELDADGQPTQAIIKQRREARFITPIPKATRRKQKKQLELELNKAAEVSTEDQQYEQTASMVNALRREVDKWRRLPNSKDWKVTPQTARLLRHWRHHTFNEIRPFFCQVEAAETAIWLTEVAPQSGKTGRMFLDHLEDANLQANPELMRLALKLATGAGKTTVMAMLIAWQTINAVRRPGSKRFTRGFLIIAPGITIRDRLRVLMPNDPDSYYASREIVPDDLLPDLGRAEIVITNYHAFKLRERMEVSKGGRALLEGRSGEPIKTLETEGQMLQRVMPNLMGMKNILALNDEAHHCYREKPGEHDTLSDLKGDEKKEAKNNAEAARLWITGLETVNRRLGLRQVIDLSATPFFLSGSGYAEGTLFPWTMSDFSLMDAIECGIVKLPRVPIDDNIPENEMPMYRELWAHIGKEMPKKGKGKAGQLDPLKLPAKLYTALEALYGHYEETFTLWRDAGIASPPCFIVVCNNTATSKLVYDYIAGFMRDNDEGGSELENGRLALFRNYDEYGNAYARPRALLIDSQQLESGEVLDDKFRKMAAPEIAQFRKEIIERSGNQAEADKILADDASLLREVMNTVGKPGRLGADIRCVVSVSMLTEGWDANTVTHVLGVRAFGTQLLCEQVIGRALRRQSYELNDKGLFNVEYADVLGIPFDFNAKPVVAPPQPPRQTVRIKAMSPERDGCEITFPRVAGYRVELPKEQLTADFNDDSTLELTPDIVGASTTKNAGIIGEPADLTLKHTGDVRDSQVLFELTTYLMLHKYREPGEQPKLHLFGQLKRIARQWLENHLVCKGGVYKAQLKYQYLADMACERIIAGINRALIGENNIRAVLDPYNPAGSTRHVGFNTSREGLYNTYTHGKCHINWAVLDSGWEGEFCRVADEHTRVLRYVKNHNLGFEVPYQMAGESRRYLPDFIVQVDDGQGPDDPLNLIVEVKGFRGEDAKAKKETMDIYWVPGVNTLGDDAGLGRWAFAEFCDPWEMQADFAEKVTTYFEEMIATQVTGDAGIRGEADV